MKIYTLFCIVFQFYIGTLIEVKPELQRNVLKFGYGINYKYEGMLAHSFETFYMVTKFMLPMIGDLKFSKLDLIILVHTWKMNISITQNQGDTCWS